MADTHVPAPGELWILNREEQDADKYPPLLILSRDRKLPRWIACDHTGQKMGLWDCTLDMYREVTRALTRSGRSTTTYSVAGSHYSHMGSAIGRAALAKKARW